MVIVYTDSIDEDERSTIEEISDEDFENYITQNFITYKEMYDFVGGLREEVEFFEEAGGYGEHNKTVAKVIDSIADDLEEEFL